MSGTDPKEDDQKETSKMFNCLIKCHSHSILPTEYRTTGSRDG